MPTLAPFINPAVNYGTDAQDYTAEAQSLQRKRSVSDAMLKRSLDPISVPVAKDNSQLSSVISPFAALGKLGETYLANKAGENVDTAETGLASRYKAAENKAIGDFTNGDTNDTKHLLKYAQSQFPTVRAAALEMLKEQQKGVIRPKDILTTPKASLASRSAGAQAGDITKLQPESEFHVVPEGGSAIETIPGEASKTTTILDKSKKYELDPKTGETKIFEMKDENGHIVKMQKELGTGKLEPIDKSNKTNIKVDTHVAGNKARSQLEEEASKALSDSYQKGQSAIQTISTVHTVKKVLEEGSAISGSAAGFRTMWNRLTDTLPGVTGKTTEERLASTAKLIQGMAQAELDASGQMKGQGQITENERALLKRTAIGDFGNSATELSARADALESAARKRIQGHESNRGRYKVAYPDVETEFFHLNEPEKYEKKSDAFKAKSSGGGMAKPSVDDPELEQYRVH